MASKQDISKWFDNGKDKGCTHVIVVCDTFSRDYYPVFVSDTDSSRDVAAKYDNVDMQKVVEVYNLNADKANQLSAHRAMNY